MAMRVQTIWGSALVVLLVIGGFSAWSLRSPIKQGVDFLQGQVGGKAQLRFAVVGDNHGDNPVYREIIDRIKDEHYAFLLNVADTSEFGKPEEFRALKDLEATLPFPVYHTVGNHDIKTDPTRESFQAAFGHGPNTSITKGDVHVLILDNADRKVGFSRETLDWLAQELAKDPNGTFMVAYHRPFGLPLASVAGDDETGTSRRSNDALLKLLQLHQVIQIFTAHLHTYIPYAVAGMPAVVTGGGGDPAQAVLGGPTNNLFHYLEVEVKNNKANITVHPVQISD
jgi:3',5'-cyclic AMP phosphodiesterase CpdA